MRKSRAEGGKIGLSEDSPRTSAREPRPRGSSRQLRLLMVSFCNAINSDSPRAIRTRVLAASLGAEWVVSRSGSPVARGSRRAGWRGPARVVARRLHPWLFVDRFEPTARRWATGWQPDGDAALLIGYPFSPLAFASKKLLAAEIPYVLDLGDPWALTAAAPLIHGLARLRARRMEAEMLSGAAGVIVTTEGQATSLRNLLPTTPILVQPNGLSESELVCKGPVSSRSQPENFLRLAHFGQVHAARIQIGDHLRGLLSSGAFQSVELHQYGTISDGQLRNLPAAVQLVTHASVLRSEMAKLAAQYDGVLAIGNLDPQQMPSKVIDYCALPAPRVAFVGKLADDSIADFVRDKPGWLVVSAATPNMAAVVWEHLRRDWSAEQLAAPPSLGWLVAVEEIQRFLRAALEGRE